MKVGVDAVLLGAWANQGMAENILDIGTGTGLLSLMLAQKSNASITAIDIDKDSVNQAKLNFDKSLWADRINVENISFQEFYMQSKAHFDLIICNPPYFLNSMKSPDKQRNIARHNNLLPLDILFKGVSTLLNETGRFLLIYPYEQKNSLIEQARTNHLFAIKEMIIRGTANKKPNRIILEFSKHDQNCSTEELIVRDFLTNDYTEAYKKITSAYYLAF